MINIYDNKLDKQQIDKIYNECLKLSYKRGEADFPGAPPTGLTATITDTALINLLLHASETKNVNIFRVYVNLFLPNENPFYHIDNENPKSKTLIYYVNNENLTINDCGETYFFYNNKITGILPVPGRIIKFNGNILHKASSFRYIDRYTIAIKWTE